MNLLNDLETIDYLNRTILQGQFDNPNDKDFFGDIYEIVNSSDEEKEDYVYTDYDDKKDNINDNNNSNLSENNIDIDNMEIID